MSKSMPAIFFGHGNPLNAIQQNSYTRAWRDIGRSLPRPRAILAISAHWYLTNTLVTAMTEPPTIHDFGGFPPELYSVQYPAPGNPELANRVRELLKPIPVQPDYGWGLDHGTWSVLCHVFPDADIPVVQLSIDETKTTGEHYTVGKKLSALRDEGVLIVGSGNLIHNLHAYAWGQHTRAPYEWATRFEAFVKNNLMSGNHAPLIAYEGLGEDALLSIPTPDHYLPLLYVVALQRAADQVTFPVQGIDGGSISMLAVQIG